MKKINYFLLVALTLTISGAVNAAEDNCNEAQWESVDSCCGGDSADGLCRILDGGVKYICDTFSPPDAPPNDPEGIYHWESMPCAGITGNNGPVPGDILSLYFSQGQWMGAMSGGWQNAQCNFECTGIGGECPYGFTEISAENHQLKCENLNFTLVPVSGTHCEQLAYNACIHTYIQNDVAQEARPHIDKPILLPHATADGPMIIVEGILNSGGTPVNNVTFTLQEMAIQQLIDGNNSKVAPVKK